MTIAKFFARLGLETDEEKAKSFESSIKNVVIGLGSAILVAKTFTNTLKKMTEEALKSAQALKQIEVETGVNTDQLQRWQSVAERTNNSAQAVTSSIKAIVANQEKIKLGQGNISGYQLLGIDPTQDPFEILEELRTETQGLSQGMKKEVLSQIGVSSELMQVLELTNDEFTRMHGNAFVMSPSQIALLNRAKQSMNGISEVIKGFSNEIVANLAPNIEKFNKLLEKWIRNNKEGLIKGIQLTFKWITKFGQAIANSVKMIDKIVRNTIGWENAIKGLLIVIAILNASLIASPIGLIIGGILLLIAVLDDLYVYTTGKGQSLFGNLMKKFPDFEKKLFGFFNKLKDVKDLIFALFKGDETGINNMIKKLGGLGKSLVHIFETIKLVFSFIELLIRNALEPFQFIISSISSLFEAVEGKKSLGQAFKDIQASFNQSRSDVGMNVEDFMKSAEQSIKNVQNVFNIKTEINTGSGDPQEISRKVEERMQKSINSSSFQRIRSE